MKISAKDDLTIWHGNHIRLTAASQQDELSPSNCYMPMYDNVSGEIQLML